MGSFKDLTGKVFGRLTVIERVDGNYKPGERHRTKWRCLCSCGNTVVVNADALTRGTQVSCGCYRNEKRAKRLTTHGMTDTRLYNVWTAIKRRCYNPNCSEYHRYGGRGISMCDEWKNDFMVFYNWAITHGYDESAPRGVCTIDRIDCDGDYSPNNCRFVTQKQQMNNVRTNHLLQYNDETHTMAEWGEITGINPLKISNRISVLGWTTERALTTP